MRITAEGWNRNHGATEIFDADLQSINTSRTHKSFSWKRPLLSINLKPNTSEIKDVTIHFVASMRFGGDYGLKTSLSKEEIARLFYLTHEAELKGLGLSPST
jgi:hypothetical protein